MFTREKNKKRMSSKNETINFKPLLMNPKKRRARTKKKYESTKNRRLSKKVININTPKKNNKKTWNDTLHFTGELFDKKLKKNSIFDNKKDLTVKKKKRENRNVINKKNINEKQTEKITLDNLIKISKNNLKNANKIKTKKINKKNIQKKKKKLIYYANKWGMTNINFSKKNKNKKKIEIKKNNILNINLKKRNSIKKNFDNNLLNKNESVNNNLINTIEDYIFSEKNTNLQNQKQNSLKNFEQKSNLANFEDINNFQNSENFDKKEENEKLSKIEFELKKIQNTMIPLLKKNTNKKSSSLAIIENSIGRSIKVHCENVIELIIDDLLKETVQILNNVENLNEKHDKKIKIAKICDIIQFSINDYERNKILMEKNFTEIQDVNKLKVKNNELFFFKYEKNKSLENEKKNNFENKKNNYVENKNFKKMEFILGENFLNKILQQEREMEKLVIRSNYKEKDFVLATKEISEDLVNELYGEIFEDVINLQSDYLAQFVQHELTK